MTVSPQIEEYVCLAVRAADELKATSILALDVSQRLVLSEVFLVLSGSSDRQVRAIVDAVEERLHTAGLKRTRREGYDEAHWVLIDYGDLVVHVLQDEDREYYALDRLWADCPVLDLEVSADDASVQVGSDSHAVVDVAE
ncbi:MULTISPECIES: ribosome silencing factor [unclassified Actinobaculum]|uniref:ribosome silencing factor n=1 Tax=unclassified Actinobaculum TaxID=2609299 RepID=UPI000D5286DC|nr:MULTISPECIES: ribosome silencing factor [unclassified Actinobaculum]AWE42232.1 ribosome silencing factor [Actinobaculum sp. 313]RTE50797.1 ribosome silencing factor [Actinobaculum sp. 352]